MPKRTDVDGRAFGLLGVSELILEERGPRGLSLRAIAGRMRMSLGSLCDHYGSRRRLMHLMCQMASQAWVKDLRCQVVDRGAQGFLPADDDGVLAARLWASWVELSRSDPELRGTVGDMRLEERAILAEATGERDDDVLDTWLAIADGLRYRIIAPVDPLDRDRALWLWARAVDGLSEAA